jgi:glycosyltransferase involved in cell wall biosynthesis
MEVSVIIPTYNSARFLTDAIDSVLAQTFKDFEVWVIDDGSTDETASLIRGYRPSVHYLRQENRGVAVARNRGIEQSRGKYVAFLDADDTWLPSKLERQLDALWNSSNCRACYSAFSVADHNLRPLDVNRSKRQGSALEDLLLRGNVVATPSTVVCERSLLEASGGFDPTMSQCADWNMWVRLAELTEFLYIDEPLVTYRQHARNMSRNAPLLERDSILVLEKGFAMRGLPESLRAQRRSALARNYMVLAGTYFHARRYSDFVRCATRSISMDVKQLAYLAGFPLRAMKRSRPRHAD